MALRHSAYFYYFCALRVRERLVYFGAIQKLEDYLLVDFVGVRVDVAGKLDHHVRVSEGNDEAMLQN